MSKSNEDILGKRRVMEKRETIYVIGHKNPDTDSICSAICYGKLKHKLDGKEYIPGRLGEINDETRFVLESFQMEAPLLMENIITQVKDIEIRQTHGVDRNLSIKKAWTMMQEEDAVTIPIVNNENGLEGLITVNDIATSYMNVYDNKILSTANTLYSNIIDTINGSMIAGDIKGSFNRGKVLIAAANPDRMESFIEKGDLVILGDRYESQLCAIEMEAAAIIVCEGADVAKTILGMADSKGCRIITTKYDAFTVARLINQSISVGYFMKRNNLTTFDDTDYIDEVKDVMGIKRYRDFPILDDDGKYVGMISRRNLLGAKGRKVILVDHNERSQSATGIEYAEILEIIDHHRIGAVETMGPVFFRNQPLGCTSTIIYQMYLEANVEIDKTTAGLLCSAILSDTLMFRSPTCTESDKAAAESLAQIADIDIKEYAEKMFSAGGNLKKKSVDKIFHQDFKKFKTGEITFGVGQVVSMNKGELHELAERMRPYLQEAKKEYSLDMIFFMMINIFTEVSEIIYEGEGARTVLNRGFSDIISSEKSEEEREEESSHIITLPGVLSRKKQLVPNLMIALNDE